MEPQAPEKFLSPVKKSLSVASRIAELKQQGIDVIEVEKTSHARRCAALVSLVQGEPLPNPYRKLDLGLEYLAKMPEDTTSPVVEATFEILAGNS